MMKPTDMSLEQQLKVITTAFGHYVMFTTGCTRQEAIDLMARLCLTSHKELFGEDDDATHSQG